MPQIIERAEQQDRREWHALMGAQVAAFAVLGCFCAWSQRYLFADGAKFFLDLLKGRAVAAWFPARWFAHLLTQYPAVFLLRNLECRDVRLVGLTYGATLFLLPPAGLLLAWWAARKAPGHYLAFPMLSHSILFLNTSFVITSEHHVAASLFWPVLYLIMFSERLTVFRSAILIALAVMATHTYESYLFLAWPLMLAAWRRSRNAWTNRRHGETATCLVCGLLFLIAFAVSLQSTIVPRDPANRSNFALSLLIHLGYPPVWFSLLAMTSVLSCLHPHRLGPEWPILRFLIGGFGLAVVVLSVAGAVIPSMQYPARVQALYVPLILGGLVALNPTTLYSLTSWQPARQRQLWRVTTWTCAVAVLFQWTATLQWNEYRHALLRKLAERDGVIAFKRSPAPKYQFNWGWTMPSLSIALSALNLGSVTTIIENPDPTSGWQPFDPRNPVEIPDLREYGISVRVHENDRTD